MKRLFIIIATVFIFMSYFISCYYDSEEVLYPSFKCDSTNITYDKTISHTMESYCTSCHSGPTAGNSVSLTSYEEVVANAERITVSIKQTGKFPMPKGGKLNDCLIRQWDLWIKAEMPR